MFGESKRRRSKDSKKSRWGKFPKRLYNALESNVHSDQIEQLKENISMFPNLVDEKTKKRLLTLSIQNGSKQCSEYFLGEESLTCNPNFILLECKFDKIIVVYELLKKLMDKYPDKFIGNERKMPLNKVTLVKRLIDPSKLKVNKKRVDYLLDNMVFFESENINIAIKSLYGDKPQKYSKLKSLIREIKLRELGI